MPFGDISVNAVYCEECIFINAIRKNVEVVNVKTGGAYSTEFLNLCESIW
jgi:hypothetical protein